MKPRPIIGALALLIVMTWVGAGPAVARAPFTSDEPWYLLDGTGVFAVDSELSDDGDSGWQTTSLGITTSLPSQSSTRFYLRWCFLSFDDGGRSALERWPEIGDAEADTTDLENWSDERRHAGWDRPEVGALGTMSLPGVGRLQYTASAWLPLADNKIYPFASQSLSVRGSLRKNVRLGSRFAFNFTASHLTNLAASGELLADEAFGERDALGAGFSLDAGSGWRCAAALIEIHGDDERWRVLNLDVAREFFSRGQLVLSWNHIANGHDDRPFASSFGLSWRLPLSATKDLEDEASHTPQVSETP